MKKILTIFILFSFLAIKGALFDKNSVMTTALAAEELILKVKENPTIVGWVYQPGKLENSYCLYERNYMILASTNMDVEGQCLF